MATAKIQLQFLFTDIDAKQQKRRELAATLQAELEADPTYEKIVELADKAKRQLKELKERVFARMGGDVEELKAIAKELTTEKVQLENDALPLLIAGKPVELKTADGREFVAQLKVKLVPKAKLEAEEAEEKARVTFRKGDAKYFRKSKEKSAAA